MTKNKITHANVMDCIAALKARVAELEAATIPELAAAQGVTPMTPEKLGQIIGSEPDELGDWSRRFSEFAGADSVPRLLDELDRRDARIKELEAALAPYSIVVVHPDKRVVKVGEVPEADKEGDCSIYCAFSGIDVCNRGLKLSGERKPGPVCPRGKS